MTTPPVVVLPDPVPPVIDYLHTVPEITAAVADRITIALPAHPVWPAIRVNLIDTYTVAHDRLDRALMQLDCFATHPAPARELGMTVRAALSSCGNHQAHGAVLCGAADLTMRITADETFTSPLWRAAITAHVYLHPDP